MSNKKSPIIKVPEVALVILMGISGSGKSSFARKHFLPTEIISSDQCRALVADDENDQSVSSQAFELVHFIAAQRLALHKLAVIDATSVQPESRKGLVTLARKHHALLHIIALDVPYETCRARNDARVDRDFGERVLRTQHANFRRSLRSLRKEGFHNVTILKGVENIDNVSIERQPLLNNRKWDHGPFDIIGDVHGCIDELIVLLAQLGYSYDSNRHVATHPEGRTAVYVGDLVGRGPDSIAVLRLVMNMVVANSALCVPGNHDMKLLRALQGRNVSKTHGLAETLEQFESQSDDFKKEVERFLYGLVSHLVLDDGKLVVAHAGLREDMHGGASGAVKAFALYGDTTGETDEFGLPVRHAWANEYRGRALVAYGHIATQRAEFVNETICLDTGCVYGGSLTALRYPERELVSTAANRMYYEPIRPLATNSRVAVDGQFDLDISDVIGKRQVQTGLAGFVTIREENSIAALEVMSRFAIDPRWLAYLPPTMAPTATSSLPDYLEHPAEAFELFAQDNVRNVICEEKHMGSRAVIVVCKEDHVAQRRFGLQAPHGGGAVATRTGRPFFTGREIESQVLSSFRDALTKSALWEELATDWLIFDAEILPWSLKAEDLLRRQYAAVGAAGIQALNAEMASLEQAVARGLPLQAVYAQKTSRCKDVAGFVAAYRQYCWTTHNIDDIKIAPFQILAGEKHVHALRSHDWHIEIINRICDINETLFRRTRNRIVQLDDECSVQGATEWWELLTAAGGEGMVVKPLEVVAKGEKGLIKPGIKCRGREYLRIIYGPEYTEPFNLERLRKRGLGKKRSLAVREFALGIESLTRFVDHEPLHRVHEAVFGVLALESEAVDPRL